MRIKRFNELFDSEEIKSQNEIPMMQGNLIKGKINYASKEEVKDLIEKVLYSFPFLYKFGEYIDDKKYKDIVFFHQKNDSWYVSIAFGLQPDNKYGMGIFYKHLDAEEGNIKQTLSFSGKEFCYFKEWSKLSFPEMVKIVNENFTPLLSRLGFTEQLSHGQDINKRKFN